MDKLVSEITALFNRLRQLSEFPLGIDQYMLLMRALRLGYGVKNDKALRQLCIMLWVESQNEVPLFNEYFDLLITPFSQAEEPGDSSPQQEPDTETKPKQSKDTPADAQKDTDKEPEPPQPPVQPPFQPPISDPGAKPEGRQQIGLPLLAGDMDIAYDPRLLLTEYLPVSERQMKQSWRFLRRMVREGPAVEIDVPGTINKLVRDGFLLTPVLRPRRINKAALLLLLDQKGSMVPFHAFAARLAKTAKDTGHLAQLAVYYFHNCPPEANDEAPTLPGDFFREHLVFQKPQCVEPHLLTAAVADFKRTVPGVVIFSDAGAARGGWSQERIESTATFIFQLRAMGLENIAWINPMPASRWANSSAAEIATFVTMFSLNVVQMNEAVNVLSGRYAGITGW